MKRELASNSRLCHRLRVATITAAAALATFLFVVPTEAQITVKMATLVPDGTSWATIVKEAAEKWKKISNGRVTVNIYWGGVSGDDPDVVRKMRLGTLHAGLLTSAGVGEIDKSVYAPDEKNIMGMPASALGPCASCHLMHKGSGKPMWARQQSLDQRPGAFCLSCHTPGGSAAKALPADFSHPMDLSLSSMKFSRSKTAIRCTTCHDLHNPLPLYQDPVKEGVTHSSFLRQGDKGRSGVCIDCRQRYASVEGTYHDLRLTAPGFKNVYGETPAQGGLCSPCHVAHKARNQKHLWSTPLGPALVEGWNPSHTAPDNIMTTVLPVASVAVQVTVEVPTVKSVAVSGTQVTTVPGQLSLPVGTV